MTLTVVLAARASSDLQNMGSLQVFCQTSHRPPQCFTGGGHSYSPHQSLLQVWSTEALYRRRVPVRHSTPSPGWHTVLAAPSGGSASTVSSRLTPSGQGAKFGQPRVTRHAKSAPIVSCGPVPVTPRASPQLLQSSQSKRPAGDKADGDDSPRKFMVGADDDDLLIDQLGQPSDLQPDLAQESL